ncbi:FAD-dependent oxidoreductase domain-containing protein 2 [Chamberlinius hualienensis]
MAKFRIPGITNLVITGATGDPLETHLSNFLHPVFYYYDRLPSEDEMLHKPQNWILPRPNRIHHVLEDFLTSWTAPLSHILPLRRFLEYCIDKDLRHFFAETCLQYALTHVKPPPTCQDHFVSLQGVTVPIISASPITVSQLVL